MLTKKKKIIMLVGMVLLLGVTAYLNVVLANKANADNGAGGDTATVGLFAEYNSTRNSARNEMFTRLDSIINTQGDEFAQARADAIAQKSKLVAAMQQETDIEYILKAKGFEDVAISLGMESEMVTVVVKTADFKQEDAIVIYNAVMEQASVDPDNVRIIPVT